MDSIVRNERQGDLFRGLVEIPVSKGRGRCDEEEDVCIQATLRKWTVAGRSLG